MPIPTGKITTYLVDLSFITLELLDAAERIPQTQ